MTGSFPDLVVEMREVEERNSFLLLSLVVLGSRDYSCHCQVAEEMLLRLSQPECESEQKSNVQLESNGAIKCQ